MRPFFLSRGACALIVVGLCLASAAVAAERAQERASLELLARMAKALSEREYEGTLVYLNGHHLSTLRIARRIKGDQAQESLLALNGPVRAVARGGRTVTCVLPDARLISVPRHSAAMATLHPSQLDVERLRAYYLIHPLGRSRVAGRDTQVVGIIPKDDLRYGYRFFIDEQTGLPLKTDLMNSAAIPIEQVMFTQIEFLEKADDEARADAPARRSSVAAPPAGAPPAEGSEAADTTPWRFVALPAGYRLVAGDPPPGQAEGGRRWFMISDGLSAVSVYIEPDQGHGFSGHRHVGAVNAAGRVVQGYQVTVVGEAPLPTVQAIAEALETQP